MSGLDLSAAVEAHRPVKGGSSMSNIPGGYNGEWIICSCDSGDAWNRMAPRIPIADYPAHLLAAAAPLIAAQVREQVAAEIEATRRVWLAREGGRDKLSDASYAHAADIARGRS